MPRGRPKKAVVTVPQPEPGRDRPAVVKKEIRQLFRDAFDALGGAQWLVDFATRDDQNARVFVSAITRLMPIELAATQKTGGDLTIYIRKAGDAKDVEVSLEPPAIEGEARLLN